ncbi:MAG: hypothetical protein AAFQ90_12685 [Pseudomonadota bacterium]
MSKLPTALAQAAGALRQLEALRGDERIPFEPAIEHLRRAVAELKKLEAEDYPHGAER